MGPREFGPNRPQDPTIDFDNPNARRPGGENMKPERSEKHGKRIIEREGHLAAAIGLLETLCREDPSEAAYQFLLARCYQESARGRAADDGAEDNIARATDILSKLVEDQPGIADYRHALIDAYTTLRVQGPHWSNDMIVSAEIRLETAIGLSKALIVEHPNVPEYAVTHIHLCHKLASILERSDKTSDAMEYLREAIERQSELIAARPEITSYRVWLATIEQSYARLLMQENNYAEAKLHLFESIKVLRPMAQKDEKKPHLRSLLAAVYARLSKVYSQLGETEDADKALEYSQSLRPNQRP